MSTIVFCSYCPRRCVSHAPNKAVPPHPAPWDRTILCPGSNRVGLVGVA